MVEGASIRSASRDPSAEAVPERRAHRDWTGPAAAPPISRMALAISSRCGARCDIRSIASGLSISESPRHTARCLARTTSIQWRRWNGASARSATQQRKTWSAADGAKISRTRAADASPIQLVAVAVGSPVAASECAARGSSIPASESSGGGSARSQSLRRCRAVRVDVSNASCRTSHLTQDSKKVACAWLRISATSWRVAGGPVPSSASSRRISGRTPSTAAIRACSSRRRRGVSAGWTLSARHAHRHVRRRWATSRATARAARVRAAKVVAAVAGSGSRSATSQSTMSCSVSCASWCRCAPARSCETAARSAAPGAHAAAAR